MQAPENVESAMGFFDHVLNGGELDSLPLFVRPDVVVPESRPGIDSLRGAIEEMRRVFSNPELRVVETVAEGDKVVLRYTGRVTHSAPLLGIPAAGKRLKVWGVAILRFQSGSIVEYRNLLDIQGILRQLRDAS